MNRDIKNSSCLLMVEITGDFPALLLYIIQVLDNGMNYFNWGGGGLKSEPIKSEVKGRKTNLINTCYQYTDCILTNAYSLYSDGLSSVITV